MDERGREGRKRTRKEEIQAHQIHACLQVYNPICPYNLPFNISLDIRGIKHVGPQLSRICIHKAL
jgi:hypothetical protein